MRFRINSTIPVLLAVVALLMAASCKKAQTLSAGGTLKFSVDTLKFDTVFTAAGSFTTGLLIYNPQSEEVKLSSVRLQGGATSYFHLNVDGFQGNNIPDLKIPPHDSIYVFATVTINPSDTLTPFLVQDNLIATLNGKDYTIPFTAYGQNAHYIISDSIATNTTWLTDKPYVVIHAAVVGPGATLTIPPNCRVYMHQDARFFVYGNLNIGSVTGTDSVVFQGDRLDRAYFGYVGYPGEWGGMYFIVGSAGNFQNTIIKNCGGATPYYSYGIQAAAVEVDSGARLTMNRTVIKNSIGVGLLGFGGSITATNCLVNTTGGQALAIIQGGTDTITNCTFANYGGTALTHSNAGTAIILNYYQPDQYHIYYGALNAVITNTIVYGSLDSEIVCDADLINAPAQLTLDHCLLKMGTVRESFITFNTCIFNQDPLFKDTNNGDFHIGAGSPAIGAGTNATSSGSRDLDGNAWTGTSKDIGCYQHQ